MSSKSTRNPFNVAFGAYLKKERNALRATSSEISTGLYLGDSLYRMIEAGSATLNINRLTYLITLFPNTKIIFERALKLLTASQTLDFVKSTTLSIKELLDQLSDQDGDLELLIKKLRNLYDYEYGSIEYRKVLDEIVLPELELYLGSENYRGKNTSQLKNEASEIFYGVPSVEIPNVLMFLESLNKRQPLHVGPIASEWESYNAKQFKSLIGLYKEHTIITNSDNLSLFQYDYLLEQGFGSFRIIFIEDKLSGEEIKSMFVEGLQAQRKKHGKQLAKSHIDKIDVKVIKSNSPLAKKDVPALLKSRNDVFKILSAYWNFTHENGIEIGFVGGADAATNYAINLTGQDSLDRVLLYEDLWKNI